MLEQGQEQEQDQLLGLGTRPPSPQPPAAGVLGAVEWDLHYTASIPAPMTLATSKVGHGSKRAIRHWQGAAVEASMATFRTQDVVFRN